MYLWEEGYINMKQIFYNILLFSLILLAGCNSHTQKEYRNDKNQLVVEEWFNEDQLRSRIIYLNEAKTDYTTLEFLENGHIKDSSTHKNNLIHGTRKIYDPANDLIHTETYVDGILNGPHQAVYGNGVASFRGFQLNGNKVGEWKFFYPEGNPITYEFYDSTGSLKYFLKYEKDGQHLQSEGSGIIDVSSIKKINGQFSLEILIAVPPNCSSSLKMMALPEGKEQVIFNDELNTIRNTISLQALDEGDYEILIELNITDKNTGKVESFIISRNITIPNA